MTNNNTRGSTQIERWFDHVVRALTVTAIVGGAYTLAGLQTQVAVLSTEVNALSQRMDDMRAASSDRYTATQARRDFVPIQDRINDHESRIRDLERLLPPR